MVGCGSSSDLIDEPKTPIPDAGTPDGGAPDAGAPDAGEPRVAETILIFGPSGLVPFDQARVIVSSPDAPVTYECSLDGEVYEPCGEDNTLVGLEPGDHDFEIAARGSALDPTPVSVSWTVVEEIRFAVKQHAVGYTHACAIDVENRLYCWGRNGFGQLGVGGSSPRTEPARVGQESDWEHITAGRFHTCGIRNGGELSCWGATRFGQAVGVSQTPLDVPTAVLAPAVSWIQVDAGEWHTCAITLDGDLYCWGYNLYGRLGDATGLGTGSDPGVGVAVPVHIDPGQKYLVASAGASHTCGVRTDGAARCWGLGAAGQLGGTTTHTCSVNGSELSCSLSPEPVAGDLDVESISAGTAHTCAVDSAGLAHCWGDGLRGQLGDGSSISSPTPQPVSAFASVAAGGTHSCGIRGDRSLSCWGDNSNSQLGFVTASSPSPTDTKLEIMWSSVSTGALGTCALAEKALFCWGLHPYADSEFPRLVVTP